MASPAPPPTGSPASVWSGRCRRYLVDFTQLASLPDDLRDGDPGAAIARAVARGPAQPGQLWFDRFHREILDPCYRQPSVAAILAALKPEDVARFFPGPPESGARPDLLLRRLRDLVHPFLPLGFREWQSDASQPPPAASRAAISVAGSG